MDVAFEATLIMDSTFSTFLTALSNQNERFLFNSLLNIDLVLFTYLMDSVDKLDFNLIIKKTKKQEINPTSTVVQLLSYIQNLTFFGHFFSGKFFSSVVSHIVLIY